MPAFAKCRPVEDETFTSWVYRYAHSPGMIFSELREVLVSSEWSELDNKNIYEDPDFDFGAPFARSVIQAAGLERTFLEGFFGPRSDWILPWESRGHYCYECLCEDVAEHRLPCWRKSWCYVITTHCERHKSQLSVSSPARARARIDKGWYAFSKHLPHVGFNQATHGRWLDHPLDRARSILARKVTKWFLRAPSVHKDTYSDVEVARRHCLKSLIKVFLRTPTRNSNAGLARYLFSVRPPQRSYLYAGCIKGIEQGVFESSPHERACALIMAGVMMSVFTDLEARLLNEFLQVTHPHLLDSQSSMSDIRCDIDTRSDYYYVRSLFSGLPISVLEMIREFIEAIEQDCLGRWYVHLSWKHVSEAWRKWHFEPHLEPEPPELDAWLSSLDIG